MTTLYGNFTLSSNANDSFLSSVPDDVMMFPDSNSQRIHIGVNKGVGPAVCVTSNGIGVAGQSNPQAPLDVLGNLTLNGYSIAAGNVGMFRNRIINGDMRVNQRGPASNFAYANGSGYNLDRFQCTVAGSSAYAVSQSNVSVGAFRTACAVRCTLSNGTLASGDSYVPVEQVVEGVNIVDLGWGTVNAVPATVSFSMLTTTIAQPLFLSVRNGVQQQPSSAALSNAQAGSNDTFTYNGSTYVASASSEGGSTYLAECGFTPSTAGWASTGPLYSSGTYTGSASTTVSGSAVTGEWLQLLYPYSFSLASYMVTNSSSTAQVPTSWVVAGSTNGSTWTLVDAQSAVSWAFVGQTQTYTPAPSAAQYSYFRFIAKTIDGGSYNVSTRLAFYSSPLASYVVPFTPSSANAWQSYTFSIPGPTTGTWATDTTAGLIVGVSTCAGALYQAPSGSTWVSGSYLATSASASGFNTSTSSALLLTGLQLERGTMATPFEFRPYALELALCQRYFWGVINASTTSATSLGVACSSTTGALPLPVTHPVTMRANATMSASTATNSFWFFGQGNGNTISSVQEANSAVLYTWCPTAVNAGGSNVITPTPRAAYVNFVASGNTSGFAETIMMAPGASILFSAEL
jgi:hypothetical protein